MQTEQTKRHIMHKADLESSKVKIKNIVGTHKHYEHPPHKAHRLCGGSVKRGKGK